jgi:uncharacterized membrane protein YfcA
METIGYVLAVVVGITIGLMGSGGSILTLPILVYLFHVNPVLATAYSLFIVGVAAWVGTLSQTIKKNIDYRTALLFAIPSLLMAFLIRRYVLPQIPDLISIGQVSFKKSSMLMICFGIVMTAVAYSMIRPRKSTYQNEITFSGNKKPGLIFLIGLGVGLLTGFIGVGGGFLIIPALVLLMHMPIRKAIGSSLLIISTNATIGFLADLNARVSFDWHFLIIYTIIVLAGLFIGILLSQKTSSDKLKTGFGWFVLFMGVFVVITELVKSRSI